MYIALQSWSHLSSVTIHNIPDADILHLANMPSLRRLRLGLHTTPIAVETQRLLQHPAFSALQELSVKCDCFAPLDIFFKTLSIAPKILSFTVEVDMDSVRVLPVSMTHIYNACSQSVLEHLRIRFTEFNHYDDEDNDDNDDGDDEDDNDDNDDDDDDDDGDDDDNNYFSISIDAAAFQPLYAFNNLRKFNFLADYNVPLDDTTLFQMARAWPLLEGFAIGGRRRQSTRITANALSGLLQHCSHLNKVSVNVDWSAVDKPDVSPDIPYQGPPHNNLSYADFGFSRIRYTAGVAAFLSAIAPKLKHITAWVDYDRYDCSDHKYITRWKKVNRLVKTFPAIREHDKRMMTDAGRVVGGDVRVGAEGPEDDRGMESELTSLLDQVSLDSKSGDDE